MNLAAIFQMLRKHIIYKSSGDSLRQLILSSRSETGQLSWVLFSYHLQKYFSELLDYFEQNQDTYKQLDEENRKMTEQGYLNLIFGEANYPAAFYCMEDPPLVLCLLGATPWTRMPCVSIVGSREPREESLLWMEKEFSLFLRERPSTVVSGGARGIDQKAHSLAIRHNMPTVVILPSGLGKMYPQSLLGWKESVLETGGCFLSEYGFSQPMQKYLFPHRNRLIAAMGALTVVVEARQRSGTLLTAQLSARWGRPVLVVPGHPMDSHFRGGLDLLADGAQLVRDAQDLNLFYGAELWSEKSNGVSVV